jgi:hypothetical protein
MKNLRSILAALAVLLMATAAHAQTTKLAATIPFNFVAGDRAYPAGDYTIGADGVVLKISNTEKTEVILSQGCESLTPSANTKVVFDRVGDNYFLRQIWVEGKLRGRQLPRSHSEMQIAQNHEKMESVIVAANIAR